MACRGRSWRFSRRLAAWGPPLPGNGDRDYSATGGLSHHVARSSPGGRGPCAGYNVLLTCASLGMHRDKVCMLGTSSAAGHSRGVTAIWLLSSTVRDDRLRYCRSGRRNLADLMDCKVLWPLWRACGRLTSLCEDTPLAVGPLWVWRSRRNE